MSRQASQSTKRLNSAPRSRRRVSGEPRTGDLSHLPTVRLLQEDGDVTPKVCQLDSVRELDEDKEVGEGTEG